MSFGLLLLLSCMSYLYILDIKPLLVASFATIFSHSIGCLLSLSFFFNGFLCCAKGSKFDYTGPICLFFFLFLWPWEPDLRNICTVDVRECFAFVLFQEFDVILSYV